MIWSCIESDIVIISSCRAARPDPHHSRCTVIGASHYPRITDLMKTDRFVMFFHCRTLCSSPSTKIYQEWSTRWTVFTCLARRQIPCGCWDLRTWIVKLMKNCSFCDVLFTAEHFIQVVVQKHTRNCQLDEQCQHVWQGCRYHADVQSKVQDCGGPAGFWPALMGGKNERSVSRRFHPPWVEYRILTTVVRNTIDQLK